MVLAKNRQLPRTDWLVFRLLISSSVFISDMSCPSICGVGTGLQSCNPCACSMLWVALGFAAAVRKLLTFDNGMLHDRVFGAKSLDVVLPLFKGDADDVEV
jgi:hypothetical protein